MNILLPKSLSKMHWLKIQAYLEKPDEELTQKKNSVFIKDGKGSFIQINYLTKITPSFYTGI